MLTAELAWPPAICLATDKAVSTGIANPLGLLLCQAGAVARGVHAEDLPGGADQDHARRNRPAS
jgi:hypothetical protein